jgi:DNA-directed RNA polymerase specialized sigma24 family protein
MTQSTDDRSRIEAAQRDPSRFGDLYEENFYRVYAYIARRVSHRHQAEDLTADVFREALAGIGKFEWRGVPFARWLLGIAARVIADYLRRLGREPGRNIVFIPKVKIQHQFEIEVIVKAGRCWTTDQAPGKPDVPGRLELGLQDPRGTPQSQPFA